MNTWLYWVNEEKLKKYISDAKSKLKPCRICGGKHLQISCVKIHDSKIVNFTVLCNCGVKYSKFNLIDLVDGWNGNFCNSIILSKEEFNLIYSILPICIKEEPIKNLDPTMYKTGCYNGDIAIYQKIKEIFKGY